MNYCFIKNLYILGLICGILTSCNKDPIVLPEQLPLGSVVAYYNGKLHDFENFSYSRKLRDSTIRFFALFSESMNDGQFVHVVSGATYWPKENCEYELTNNYNALANNSMSIDYHIGLETDLPGPKYEYFPIRNDYFVFEKYDTINHIVSGRCDLKFKRTFSEEFKSFDFVHIQIAFHVEYTVR